MKVSSLVDLWSKVRCVCRTNPRGKVCLLAYTTVFRSLFSALVVPFWSLFREIVVPFWSLLGTFFFRDHNCHHWSSWIFGYFEVHFWKFNLIITDNGFCWNFQLFVTLQDVVFRVGSPVLGRSEWECVRVRVCVYMRGGGLSVDEGNWWNRGKWRGFQTREEFSA